MEENELREMVGEYAEHGRKFEKAIDTVLDGGVKEARFLPSGRKIITVVGRSGDEFVDPEKPYCSCSNFFFRVAGGREDLCYHLLSYKIAAKAGVIDKLEFSDDEYGAYLSATVRDIFETLTKSSSGWHASTKEINRQRRGQVAPR